MDKSEIRLKFENEFTKGCSKQECEAMTRVNTEGGYMLMQARTAWEWFLAGHESSKTEGVDTNE